MITMFTINDFFSLLDHTPQGLEENISKVDYGNQLNNLQLIHRLMNFIIPYSRY